MPNGETMVGLTVDEVQQGLKCCRNWEDLKNMLPECRKCPYRVATEGTCIDMNAQIDAAMALIRAQDAHIRELHEGLLRLKKAVEEA